MLTNKQFNSLIKSYVNKNKKNITNLSRYYNIDAKHVHTLLNKITVVAVNNSAIKQMYALSNSPKYDTIYGLFHKSKNVNPIIFINRTLLKNRSKSVIKSVLLHEFAHAFQLIKTGYTNHDMEFLFMWWSLTDKNVDKTLLINYIERAA